RTPRPRSGGALTEGRARGLPGVDAGRTAVARQGAGDQVDTAQPPGGLGALIGLVRLRIFARFRRFVLFARSCGLEAWVGFTRLAALVRPRLQGFLSL